MIHYKLLFILFFLLLIAALPKPIIASWNRISNTPVLTNGNNKEWDSKFVSSPSVLFNGSKYYLWYMGSNNVDQGIGFAQSSDGISWTKNKSSVINGNINSDNFHLHNPRVILFNNLYKMWFSASTSSSQKFHINYIESEDGINWVNPVLNVLSPSNQWEMGLGISFPNVTIIKNKYFMWYAADGVISSNLRWRIGYATSSDGLNWEKYPTPILDSDLPWEKTGNNWGLGNPMVILENNTFHMFYHGDNDIGHATSGDGIHWTKDPNNPVFTHNSDPGAFDGYRVMDPYVIKWNGKYLMYYTGSDTRGNWQIGVAQSDTLDTAPPSVSSTPSPTLTPTPSPTVTPTQTPIPTATPTITPTPRDVSRDPIILIPGLGASWNPQAIFSCTLDSYGEWKLGPYVSLYKPFMKTLTEKASLALNKDVYLYAYDWRQPLDSQGEKLKNYIDTLLGQKPPGTKVRLVGHSLGGLVIRSYLSHYPGEEKASIAVTVGTPHRGTVLAYPLWENGEISHVELPFQIALTQLINHCRRVRLFSSNTLSFHRMEIESNRVVVQTLAPSLQSLLPTFDFLKINNGLLPVNSLHHKNDWLPTHTIPFLNGTALFTLSGNTKSTLRFISATLPSAQDLYAGNWIDGKPQGEEKSTEGDGTVLHLSSILNGATNQQLDGDHGDIIVKPEAIRLILRFLQLPDVEPATVPIGELTADSVLTIAIDVPARLQLTYGNRKIESVENLLALYNPQIGMYPLTIIPTVTKNAKIEIAIIHKNHSENEFLAKDIFLRKGMPLQFTLELQKNADGKAKLFLRESNRR